MTEKHDHDNRLVMEYRDYQIEAFRDESLGGEELLHFIILRKRDLYVVEDTYTSDVTPVAEFVEKCLKPMVDDIVENPLDYYDSEEDYMDTGAEMKVGLVKKAWTSKELAEQDGLIRDHLSVLTKNAFEVARENEWLRVRAAELERICNRILPKLYVSSKDSTVRLDPNCNGEPIGKEEFDEMVQIWQRKEREISAPLDPPALDGLRAQPEAGELSP